MTGDGVAGTDLDGDAVDPLDRVGRPGRLDPARGGVVGRGLGLRLGAIGALGDQVEGIEAETGRAETGEKDQGGQADQDDDADRAGEVEGSGKASHQG